MYFNVYNLKWLNIVILFKKLFIFFIQQQEVFNFVEPVTVMPKSTTVPTATVLPQPTFPVPMDISENVPEAFSRVLLNVQNIDANDKENPQLVSEYVNDIYDYMRDLEVTMLISIVPTYK